MLRLSLLACALFLVAETCARLACLKGHGSIALEEHWSRRELEGAYSPSANPTGGTVDELRANLEDIQVQRVKQMDENDVEFMVLSLDSPGAQGISDPTKALETATDVHNDIASRIASTPSRFGTWASVPMHNASVASEDLKRTVNDNRGPNNGMLHSTSESSSPVVDYKFLDTLFYDQLEYDVFWKTLTELDAPVYLHPRLNTPAIARALYSRNPWMRNANQEFATTLSNHVFRLVTSGVFDRFPNLKLIVGHMGERLPSDFYRIDTTTERGKRNGLPMKHSFSSYWQTNILQTTSADFSTPVLRFHREVIGIFRMMFSVDYPFETLSRENEWLESLEGTLPDELYALKRGNVMKSFKLTQSIWVETVLYGQSEASHSRPSNIRILKWPIGFLVCNYFLTLYITLAPDAYERVRTGGVGHVNTMLKISTIMFLVATVHISINYYRYSTAFSGKTGVPPPIFLQTLTHWHRIMKDLLFVIQEVLGSSAAVYRTWILWDRSRRLVSGLVVLVLVEAAIGISACVMYINSPETNDFIHHSLSHWLIAHSSILVVVNTMTTSLMAFRIWTTQITSSKYFTMTPSKLGPVLRILLESAMMQLIAETFLLAFFLGKVPAMNVTLDAITPVIAITFNTLTLRIKLYNFRENNRMSLPLILVDGVHPPTIGSVPMPPLPVEVDIPGPRAQDRWGDDIEAHEIHSTTSHHHSEDEGDCTEDSKAGSSVVLVIEKQNIEEIG
ncbi:hypothetical protein PQX77_014204 [Marasmius sp. AFHP31]|nr:hypothetical protein PQX77_014204 [Marasmius sp. AFHP31]